MINIKAHARHLHRVIHKHIIHRGTQKNTHILRDTERQTHSRGRHVDYIPVGVSKISTSNEPLQQKTKKQ